MKKKKISLNAMCFILAGTLAIATPCAYVIADAISTTKRDGSGLHSTGNVEYQAPSGSNTVLFAVADLYYLENRIEDELSVICQ